MKKVSLSALILIFLLTGCGSSNNGELTGVVGRKKFFEPEPFEMSFIPAGSFMMGPSDEDATFAMNSISKSVTVDAFWMDQTEITNNKYRQFVFYVRDSILRTKLGVAADVPDRQYFMVDKDNNVIEPNVINWEEKIDPEEPATLAHIEEMYYPPEERFNGKKQVDVRKLNYSYFWVDYQSAAKSTYQYDYAANTGKYNGQVTALDGTRSAVKDRSSFIKHNIINVYPDTLCWIRDFTYSFNDPQAALYFWHPSFDDYPVVGITWVQATAFSIWRTDYMNSALRKEGVADVSEYRLCTHGADHIPVTTKVASLPTSNHCEEIILMMETCMQEKLHHIHLTNMVYMIWQGTYPNGHVALTIHQLISSSTTCSQIMSIMQHRRILR
jgi:sulfatase modifying factor 1